LQSRGVRDGEKRIVVLAVGDIEPLQLRFHERMAVQIVGRLEREKRGDADHHRTEVLIPDVEVVVHEPAALLRQDPVVWIFGWKLRRSGPECRPLFHALEDEVDTIAILLLHLLQIWQDEVLFPDALLRPLHRDSLLAGESLHPLPVFRGPLPQGFLGDRSDAKNFTEEVNHLPWP
jgi:hypothetical protein